ncbi:DUF1707 SHOCT-like domain-containing protein [Pseudonocardia alaniniphila]|uniref:DUF1707 domain-containing protein n=1 Tax=Pseudonocardia alaniniphila TaxID=75291 RepID=A0ABS9TKG4_9PSEU|nr:DUF1707 domain-containing protein [Pseudonocardia alaniniphila]MCH6168993.1 DUF1707 domain-containing protein [Pseudonocardia alaniniphila]
MTSGEESSPLRIGNAERTAAMKALDEHLSAGRLGIEEYGERTAKAANAVVASEIAELFTDLPEPRPQLPGTAAPLTAPLPVAPAAGEVAPKKDGYLLLTITPVVALLLFFITKQWYFFLLIPLMGALVYGGGVGKGNGRRDRRRDRR